MSADRSTDLPAAPGGLCVLAFDSSTERLAVGLYANGRSWHRVADGGAQASATLLPHIADLLAHAGCSRTDITHIAFGRGPGAFTGLRTACAVAQGLGLGLGRPVIALDSLLIVAEDARWQDGHALSADGQAGTDAMCQVSVLMDARMDEVYAGRYAWDGAGWHVLDAAALLSLPALQDGWSATGQGGDVVGNVAASTAASTAADAATNAATNAAHPQRHRQLLAGSALTAFASRLTWPAASATYAQEHDRAAALLRLAVSAAQAGEGADAALALPLYLRDKVALTTQERQAVRDRAAARVAAGAALPTTTSVGTPGATP